jgi:hypothetical protein
VSGLMSGLWVLFTSRPRNPEPNWDWAIFEKPGASDQPWHQ